VSEEVLQREMGCVWAGLLVSVQQEKQASSRSFLSLPLCSEYSTYAATALVKDAASEARVLRRAQNLVVAAAGALEEAREYSYCRGIVKSCYFAAKPRKTTSNILYIIYLRDVGVDALCEAGVAVALALAALLARAEGGVVAHRVVVLGLDAARAVE
jgi:hypothetical protein